MAYWDALQWSLSHGLAYDMGGAPTSGIGEFKIAMGGQAELSATAERTRLRGVQGRAGVARTAGQPSGRSAAHRPDVTGLRSARPPPGAGPDHRPARGTHLTLPPVAR